MDSCYSDEHIAGDHIHTDISRTCNTEEPQQKYRLVAVSNGLLGLDGVAVRRGRGLEHVLMDPNHCPLLLQWFESLGPHEAFLTHQ